MLDPNQSYTFGKLQDQKGGLDPYGDYSFSSPSRELRRTAPITGAETAMIIGLDIIPAIGGTIIGALGGPPGMIALGATGGGFGNYWSQKYRIARGLQDEIGFGELAASTVLSGIPLSVPAKAGMAGKTAIRAGQGSVLAGADLAARTTIDEGRLPTDEEVATSLLFGGVFGGTLGAAEAKWLSNTTGVDYAPNATRDETIDLLTNAVDEAGGPLNFDSTQKIGFFTFRDPQGNFTFRDPDPLLPTTTTSELATTTGIEPVTALGPRRLRQLDQPELPGPRGLPGPAQRQLTDRKEGSDVIIELTEDQVTQLNRMPSREYAEGLMSQLENKLLLETTQQINDLALTNNVPSQFEPLKLALENKIAKPDDDIEILTPAQLWQNIALKEDSLFRTPVVSDTSLEQLLSKIAKSWEIVDISDDAGPNTILKGNDSDIGRFYRGGTARNFVISKKGNRSNEIEMIETGYLAFLHPAAARSIDGSDQPNKFISVGAAGAKGGGQDAYQAILQYAHNTGKVYVPAPTLSPINKMRTLSAMFSSALKNKSTKHFLLHETHIDAMELPTGYKWGDNFERDLNYLATGEKILVNRRTNKLLQDYEFDFSTNRFTRTQKDGTKTPISHNGIREIVTKSPKFIDAGVGETTLKRAIITKSLSERNPADGGRLGQRDIAPRRDGKYFENLLPAGIGLAGFVNILSDDERDDLAQAGGSWGLVLAALASAAGIKTKKATSAIKNGSKKGQQQNVADKKIRAVGKTPKPDPIPKPRANKKGNKFKDPTNPRDYRIDELVDFIKSDNINEATKIQAIAVLAERASRDTKTGRRTARKLEELFATGKASGSKVTTEPFALPAELATPQGRQDILSRTFIEEGIKKKTKQELLFDVHSGNELALEELKRRATKNPKTKRFMEQNNLLSGVISTGATGAAVMSLLMEDDGDNQFVKAGIGGGELLVLLALSTLGYKGASKFIKTDRFKNLKAQARNNPEAVEPTVIKEERVRKEQGKNAFVPPGTTRKAMRDFKDIISDALDPISRKLKGVNEAIAEQVRGYDRLVGKRTAEYLSRGTPFLESMSKLLKGKKEKEELFINHLLNGRYTEITRDILDPLNAPTEIGKQMKEMRQVLDEIRTYARERGGLDVGYIEDYFPRIVEDYKSFRAALEGTLDQPSKNAISEALDEYAKKNYDGKVDLIPESEQAEVVSRVLRGATLQEGMTPGNVKSRKILEVDRMMQAGYKKPADAFVQYVERMVQATERRNFFYKKPSSAQDVGFEGSRDRVGADLGSKMEVSDGIANVVLRLQKQNKLSAEDVEVLQKLLESRFSGQSVGAFTSNVKNLNYISTMGNFGSAITQLGDFAYSIHFAGFDNTFQSVFNRNFDFVKLFGLSNADIGTVGSSGFTQKLLDNVFSFTQLKRLDQFAKNTTMNALWRKHKQMASKDANGLIKELQPAFGDRAKTIVRDLQTSNPNSNQLPKSIEELVWYKFLDLNPATLTEMPATYSRSGNLRIAYMLKSFTLKQIDVFRQAGIDDITEGVKLYQDGNQNAGARLAAKGAGNLVKLASIFFAANATTDVIKDTLYGRPTELDDLTTSNLLKLVGVNRYLAYEAKRKGLGSAVGQLLLPPFTFFDRLGRDLINIYEGKEYQGNFLQGTPLDIIYWHYLGGLDKIEKDN